MKLSKDNFIQRLVLQLHGKIKTISYEEYYTLECRCGGSIDPWSYIIKTDGMCVFTLYGLKTQLHERIYDNV